MVAVDQPVVEVETAKAMVEVPCPYGGVVTARYGEAGDEVPVGQPAGDRPAAGPDAPAPDASSGSASARAAEPAAKESGSGNVLVGYGTGGPAPRRRRVPPGLNGGAVRAPGGRRRTHRAARRPPPRPRSPDRWPSCRRWCAGWPANTASTCGVARQRARRPDPARPTSNAPSPTPPCRPPRPRPYPHRSPRRPSGSRCAGLRGAVAEKLSRSRREIPDATAGWTPTPPNCWPPAPR